MSPYKTTYDAFISYASPDLAFAAEVHRRLTAAGFSVWFDKARLDPGCDWHKEIEAGCDDSRVVLPILTLRWKNSEWTKFETYGAELMIPILCEGSFREVSTPPLTRFQSHLVDFTNANESDWTKLFAAIRALLAKPVPDKLERLAQLRYHSNPFFVGRENELLRIHEELHQNPTAVLTQGRVRAIAALGGVGKTTLARQYAEKFWRLYPHIFWVDARLGFETEFARIFDVLFRAEQNVGLQNAVKAVRALQELNNRMERLLILDNAEDEESTQVWIPKTGGCRTLITSRFAGWSAVIKTIHLYVLEKEPACTLLRTRSGREDIDLAAVESEACATLAEKLGYLPLALEQAAAYIAEQGEAFGFNDYLRLYEQATADLLAQRALGSTEYPDSVITTWKATIAKLPSDARAILRLASLMADTPLPISLLAASWQTVQTYAAQMLASATGDKPASIELAVRQAAASLKRYSMARFDGSDLQFHNLVQTIERIQMPADMHEAAMRMVERILGRDAEVVAQNFEYWDKWRILLPHLQRLRQHAVRAGKEIDSELITGVVLFHLSQGKYAEALSDAETAFREAVRTKTFLAGASEANNVAVALGSLGRHSEALPWLEKALEIARNHVSENHGLVLKFRATMATALRNAGRFAEAAVLLEEIVPMMEQLTWFDKKDVIEFKSHLATAKERAGELSAAIELERQCVDYAEEHFGPDHPITISCSGALGEFLVRGRRLKEAEDLLLRVTDAATRLFGPEHPNTLHLNYVLAALFHFKGDLDEAESRHRKVLDGHERVLGADHERTLASVSVLSSILRELGNLSEAEKLCRRVLIGMERTLGSMHPSTFDAINGLALVLIMKNDNDEAESLCRRALSSREQVLGPRHPKTLESLHNMGAVLHKKGDLSGAEPLYRRSLAERERVIGLDDNDTQNTMLCLAALCEQSGRKEEALGLRLTAIEHRHGNDHPEATKAAKKLAIHYYENGNYAAAEPLDRRVAENSERALLAGHPDVATSWHDYALTLRNLGRFKEAEQHLRHALNLAGNAPATFPADSPVFAHWRTNLATLLVVQDKLPEANSLLRDCWNSRQNTRDLTTGRILFLLFVIARMQDESSAIYIRLLKTLLDGNELVVPAAVSRVWRIPTVLNYVRERLPADAGLLVYLLEALNDSARIRELDVFTLWSNQPAVSLDTPWPG